jgi:sec-independent protein translocase protein TatC
VGVNAPAAGRDEIETNMSLTSSDAAEDMFEDTRMSFGDHLEELRLHLWRAIAGFLIALFFSFFIGKPVLRMISAPVEEQLLEFYANRAKLIEEELDRGDAYYEKFNQPIQTKLALPADLFTEDVRKKMGETEDGKIEVEARFEDPLRWILKQNRALQLVTRRPALSTLSIQEAFMAYFKVCIGVGFVLGSPWIFYQVWLFIAAGLYPHEKRLVHVYLPVSLGLFLFGVVICQLFVIPKAIEALLWFNQWLGLEPDLRFNEWLGFAIMMPLVFGISFQLPLVMMFLERVGIFTVPQFIGQWRIAFFAIHVFAAIITPSVDVISMELLALPMFGLYWLGIFLCRWNRRPEDTDVDVPESDEMVEV